MFIGKGHAVTEVNTNKQRTLSNMSTRVSTQTTQSLLNHSERPSEAKCCTDTHKLTLMESSRPLKRPMRYEGRLFQKRPMRYEGLGSRLKRALQVFRVSSV
jgi:hypothetical protein